jgi:hypothetical protein
MLTDEARRRQDAGDGFVVVASVVTGTFVGQDDHFPFGPHRMFPTRNELNGRVNSAQLRFKFADGSVRPVVIDSHTVGLRRAEGEGLEDRFVARPELLGHLAGAYETFNPTEPEVVAAELIEKATDLEQGRPVGQSATRVLAAWSR